MPHDFSGFWGPIVSACTVGVTEFWRGYNTIVRNCFYPATHLCFWFCHCATWTLFSLCTYEKGCWPCFPFQSLLPKRHKQTSNNVSIKICMCSCYWDVIIFIIILFSMKEIQMFKVNFLLAVCFRPSTPSPELLRVTVTSSETDEKNATFKVVTKVSWICKSY